ncbi:hypothetical protein K490DRAFT_65106 [Saccharata proteae CBS 121410]|uniref:Uncharacterized protein n=1 Tax=Saccharata proteae CBS 121410 TaxID=1314787 RepID=A0A9P4LZ77_9PEZI|nr:hypothetical protein K490DRAFT_65106 [Saccharata proteae CBS 121410]
MKSLKSTLLATALLAPAAHSANITFCADDQCELPPLGNITITPSSGCQTNFSSLALAADWSLGEDNASNQAIRFYRSIDCFALCGSDHLLYSAQGTKGFMSWGFRQGPVMQSFEVVELDDEGRAPGYGYCGVRHGDAKYVNGRTVKFQQVAKGWFLDVPVEEWDESVHMKIEDGEVRMDAVRHGWVMQYGMGELRKVHKMGRDMWSYVLLEDWDDEKYVESDEPLAWLTDIDYEEGVEEDYFEEEESMDGEGIRKQYLDDEVYLGREEDGVLDEEPAPQIFVVQGQD